MSQNRRRSADDPLLLALACGATVENAARSAGVSEKTVQRRLRDPEFQKRLQQMRADMVQRASGMLTAAAMEAVKTLSDLQQKSVAAPVRLGAARSVLEIGIKMREVADLEVRLNALEEQAALAQTS